jgi:hypothetical protein
LLFLNGNKTFRAFLPADAHLWKLLTNPATSDFTVWDRYLNRADAGEAKAPSPFVLSDFALSEKTDIRDAAAIMADRLIAHEANRAPGPPPEACVVTARGGRPMGLITIRDLLRALSAEG